MKEVNIIPDDAKSAESLKQLEQVVKFDSISYRIHMLFVSRNEQYLMFYRCFVPYLNNFLLYFFC